MEIIKTPLKDCVIIKSKLFGDQRGFFLESFNQQKLFELGLQMEVKQINFAKSGKNVLRGLHFQREPMAQAKLVSVVSGGVIDVAVDIRKSSPTFGQSFVLEINSPDTLLYIPRGFAHGYYTLAEDTVFYYAVDNFYAPTHEGGVLFSDPALNLDWPFVEQPLVSEKDLKQPLLSQATIFS